MASNARVRPLWVKLRNTRNEQIFSALPPITDILGGRLARLSSGGRECFHSIQYSANVPWRAPCPRLSRLALSLPVGNWIVFYSFVVDTRSRLRMNGRLAPTADVAGRCLIVR